MGAPLQTWTEVLTVIAAEWRVASRGQELVAFCWAKVGGPDEILQAVFAELGGRQRVIVGVNVAPAAGLSLHRALTLNGERLIGSLMILKGNIVLREVLTLGRFDATELEEVVTGLAE